MEKLNEVKEFIMDNRFKYLEFLSQIGGFPYVCDISSTIMNIYLYKRFGITPCHLDGDYNDEIHFWLQIGEDDIIVDFVGFQFEDDLVNLSVDELKKALNKNYPFVYKDDLNYNNYAPLMESFPDYDVLLGALDNYDFDNYLNHAKELLIKQGYINN